MSVEVLFVFVLLGLAVVLFVTEWIRADVVAILVLVALALSGVVTIEEALGGFSSEAVMAIASLLVIGHGLVRSGVVRWVAVKLRGLAGGGERRLMLVSTLAPGLLSGFINIVAAVSVFIPAVRRLSLSGGIAASQLLMPMAFAGLVGSNLSLIGASHNLVVDSLMTDAGLTGFGFFEFTVVGAVLVPLVVVYSLLLGRSLLPAHSDAREGTGRKDDLAEVYHLQERLLQLWVRPGSEVAGTSLAELGLGRDFGLSVLSLLREDSEQPVERHRITLEDGDILLVGGRHERVDAVTERHPGLVALGPPGEDPFAASEAELVEVVVPARSPVIGRTIRELDLRRRSGLTAVALWRGGPVRTDVSDYELQAGDSLVLFGASPRVRCFEPEPELLWSRPPRQHEAPPELRRLGLPAAAVFLVIIAVAALGWVSVAIATLAGAAAMVLMGVMSPNEAYRAIDWRTIVLIGGMLPMGTALKNTGAADLLANLLVQGLGGLGPLAVLAGIAAVAMLLTQPLHHAAVAVIMAPVAITAAQTLGANPRAFTVAVVAGASANFLLPVGHPAPLLVQRPGGYRSLDYVRFGLGLSLLTLATIALVVPLFWPLIAEG